MDFKIPQIPKQMQLGVITFIIVATILTIANQGYIYYEPGFVYLVSVDGKEVGVVRQEEDLDNIINHITKQEKNKKGHQVMIVEEISTKKEFRFSPQVNLPTTQYNISQRVSFQASGTMIIVGGEPTVIVENEVIAKKVIKDVVEHYTAHTKGTIVDKPEILTEITYENISVKPEEITEASVATSLLLRGTTNFQTYTVSRGDSLWTIAANANVPIDQLKEANNLKGDSLREGQELKLTTSEPILDVKIVEQYSVFDSIPFSTMSRQSSDLFYWQSREHTAGVPGKRETKYLITKINGEVVEKNQISTTVVKEPVTRITETGTAKLPSKSTSRFRWPLQAGVGQITSPFGNRNDPFSGRIAFHTGVDVASAAGTPVYAAESGTVRFAGRQGSYGNLVIIQHSNGYSTYYAHLSSINTSVGSTVSKGQLIGRVGRTGSATGNHLHFEVRSGGKPINPMGFYRP